MGVFVSSFLIRWWCGRRSGLSYGGAVAAWFTAYMGRPCTLVRQNPPTLLPAALLQHALQLSDFVLLGQEPQQQMAADDVINSASRPLSRSDAEGAYHAPTPSVAASLRSS